MCELKLSVYKRLVLEAYIQRAIKALLLDFSTRKKFWEREYLHLEEHRKIPLLVVLMNSPIFHPESNNIFRSAVVRPNQLPFTLCTFPRQHSYTLLLPCKINNALGSQISLKFWKIFEQESKIFEYLWKSLSKNQVLKDQVASLILPLLYVPLSWYCFQFWVSVMHVVSMSSWKLELAFVKGQNCSFADDL